MKIKKNLKLLIVFCLLSIKLFASSETKHEFCLDEEFNKLDYQIKKGLVTQYRNANEELPEELYNTCVEMEFEKLQQRIEEDINHVSIDSSEFTRRLSDARTAWYMNSIAAYKAAGLRELKEAEDICWYLPNNPVNDLVSAAIVGAITAVYNGSPAAGAVAAALSAITTYALQSKDKYFEIRRKLALSQRCYEVADSLFNEYLRLEAEPQYFN